MRAVTYIRPPVEELVLCDWFHAVSGPGDVVAVGAVADRLAGNAGRTRVAWNKNRGKKVRKRQKSNGFLENKAISFQRHSKLEYCFTVVRETHRGGKYRKVFSDFLYSVKVDQFPSRVKYWNDRVIPPLNHPEAGRGKETIKQIFRSARLNQISPFAYYASTTISFLHSHLRQLHQDLGCFMHIRIAVEVVAWVMYLLSCQCVQNYDMQSYNVDEERVGLAFPNVYAFKMNAIYYRPM